MAGYGLWTDGRTDRRMDRETCQLKYYLRCGIQSLLIGKILVQSVEMITFILEDKI